jgi:superfamily II DNA/RNA helicase
MADKHFPKFPDFGTVDVVVNYDYPKDEQNYILRVGLTGRKKGKTGIAYTFFTSRSRSEAKKLVNAMKKTKQKHFNPKLMALAGQI